MRRGLPDDRRLPLAARLAPTRADYLRIITAHELAIHAGQPGYIDPTTGFFVFTAAEHWERGSCCNSGCRHCPYAKGPRGPHDHPVDRPEQAERAEQADRVDQVDPGTV